VTKDSASSMRVEARSEVASPVAARNPSGRTSLTEASNCSWLVPGAAVTHTAEKASSPPR
jgi:hypothetical protein